MPEALDIAAVRQVAHLARLTISDEEAALYAGQLSRILEYVRQLGELNTDAIPPTAHPLPLANVLREDEVRPSWTNEAALANAPQRHGPFFQVPKVLEQETS